MAYQGFGGLTSLSYGNGLLLTKTYDTDYRIDLIRLRDQVSTQVGGHH